MNVDVKMLDEMIKFHSSMKSCSESRGQVIFHSDCLSLLRKLKRENEKYNKPCLAHLSTYEVGSGGEVGQYPCSCGKCSK